MLVKLYFFTWVAVLLFAGVLWLGGVMTTVAAIVLGVIALTLVYSGLMGVLPSTFHRYVGAGHGS